MQYVVLKYVTLLEHKCNDRSLSVWLGLGATVWREWCCSVGPPLPDVWGRQGDRVMYLPPGRATREVFSLVLGALASGCVLSYTC